MRVIFSAKTVLVFLLCWVLAVVTIGPLLLIVFGFSDLIISPFLYDDSVDIQNMTVRQMMDYIRSTNSSSCQLERDFGGDVNGKKSVCLDPLIGPEPGKCLVYSFGVNHEWKFDEAMADYGCQVYAFDPMIKQSYNRTNRIHVSNLALSFKSGISVQNWTVVPLTRIYHSLIPFHGMMPISYLKIDIEDFDVRILSNIIQTGMMKHVRQLALEVHVEPEGTIENLRDMVEVLQVKPNVTICLAEMFLNYHEFVIQAFEEIGMVRFGSNGIPTSKDWYEPLQTEGILDYEITWYTRFDWKNIVDFD